MTETSTFRIGTEEDRVKYYLIIECAKEIYEKWNSFKQIGSYNSDADYLNYLLNRETLLDDDSRQIIPVDEPTRAFKKLVVKDSQSVVTLDDFDESPIKFEEFESAATPEAAIETHPTLPKETPPARGKRGRSLVDDEWLPTQAEVIVSRKSGRARKIPKKLKDSTPEIQANLPRIRIVKSADTLPEVEQLQTPDLSRVGVSCPLCTEMFDKMSGLDDHLVTAHSVDTANTCPICNLFQSNSVRLKAHLKVTHSCKVCMVCFTYLSSIAQFKEHSCSGRGELKLCYLLNGVVTSVPLQEVDTGMVSTLEVLVEPDSMCNVDGGKEDKVYRRKSALKSLGFSIKRKRGRRPKPLSEIVRQKEVKQERKRVAPVSTCEFYGCPFCTHMSQVKRELLEHFEIHQEATICLENISDLTNMHVNCSVCADLVSVDNFAAHLLSHAPLLARCESCLVVFPNRRAVLNHIVSCSKQPVTVERLQTYIFRDKLVFPCFICGVKTEGFEKSYTHAFQHKREPPFLCDLCGMDFVTREELKPHLEEHFVSRKRYKCPDCDKIFLRRFSLNDHREVVHFQQRRHICEICGAAFAYGSALGRHKKRHTGERPFACETCGQSFYQKEHLRYHTQTHAKGGSGPYSCPHCQKVFPFSHLLDYHIDKVHKKTVFLCDDCGVVFNSQTKLANHIRTVHRVSELEPDLNVDLDCG